MSEETLGLPLRTLETVGTDTPARAATIRIEGLCVRDMIALPCEICAKSLDKTFYCMLTLAGASVNSRLCAGKYIGRILYSAFGKYMQPPTRAGIAQSVDILREVAAIAAKSNITLVLEVVNRYETNILNTAAQGVEMCKRIDAPNVKVH